MPPAAFSEHPKYMPAYGATYIAQVLDALTADPAVWATTVLLVMYDENDGYFDHIVPPQPPTSVLPGQSSVSTAGEVHDVVNPLHQPHYTNDQLPYRAGAARADVRHLAMEQGRLHQLPGGRPYLRDSPHRGAVRRD